MNASAPIGTILAKFSGRCSCGASVAAGERIAYSRAPGARGISGCGACQWTGEGEEDRDAGAAARAEEAARIAAADAKRAAAGEPSWADQEDLRNSIEDLSSWFGGYRIPATINAEQQARLLHIAGLAWRTKAFGLRTMDRDFARACVERALSIEKAAGRKLFNR